MSILKVSNFMTQKVLTAHPDDGVRHTFFRMREDGVRHRPVINDDNKLIGIISDRELRRPNWVDEAQDITHVYLLDNSMSVCDVMITNVHVLHTYDTLNKAVNLLLEEGIGAAPVLDKTGTLVGMLSSIDLLRALSDMIKEQKKTKKKK